jgi:hypothetical protein
MFLFIYDSLAFLFVCIFVFYFPGRWLISRLQLQFFSFESLFLSSVSGILLFLLILYLFSWVHLDFFALLFYAVIYFLLFREKLYTWRLPNKEELKIGSLLAVFSTFFSIPLTLLGIYGNTIFYHFDDMLQVSLIQELEHKFPPDIPSFTGVPLRGYHFFYDFLLAKIGQFTGISPFSLHFHLFPLLFAFLWGLGVFAFMLLWTKKKFSSLLAVPLSMFGGSFVYIYYFMGERSISFLDGLGISQPAYSVYNPRITFSIIVLFFAFIVLYRFLQIRKNAFLVLFVLAAGLLPMIDVYAAMVLYSGFAFLVFIELFQRRFQLLVSSFFIGIFFFATYWVFVGHSGGLIWKPLWAPIGILQSFSNLGYDWRVYTYMKDHNYLKLVLLESYGLFIFLILNLGTRVFGILGLGIHLGKYKKRPSLFFYSLFIMTVTAIFIPLLFIQSGKVFELIQLGFYYLLLCSLFASIGFYELLHLQFRFQKILKPLLMILFFVLTLPSTFWVYSGIISDQSKRTSLDSDYFKALAFLRKQGQYTDTVFNLPPQNFGPDTAGLSYWYSVSSPEISAFADKQTYFDSPGNTFPGMHPNERLNDLFSFLTYRNNPNSELSDKTATMLRKNHIVYIFTSYPIDSLLHMKGMRVIYQQGYSIYELR